MATTIADLEHQVAAAESLVEQLKEDVALFEGLVAVAAAAIDGSAPAA